MADGGNTLKIALGTKKLLHGDILSLLDLDSDASDVTISLTAESQNVGHFEIDRYPNQRKTSFSARNFNAGHVYYVHDIEDAADITLTPSDERDSGKALVLHVEPFELQIYVVNNTGMTVAAGSSALLTSYNLTFTTNAPEQGLNLRYVKFENTHISDIHTSKNKTKIQFYYLNMLLKASNNVK